MQTTAERCARLTAALGDLAAQEAAALAAQDFDAVLALQDRAGPIVELLAAHADEISRRPALRAELDTIRARRARTLEQISTETERTRSELAETGVAQRRVARIAPVYGRAAMAVSQLHAVG